MNSQQERYLRHRRKVIAAGATDEFLEILERRFETNLPCFQGGAGQYDPLDAMRRDAYREVVLFLRSERAAHEQQQESKT